MDTGHGKGKSPGYFGRMWLSCSLEQKVRYISRSAAAVSYTHLTLPTTPYV